MTAMTAPRLSTEKSFLISMALHTALVAPFFLYGLLPHSPPKHLRLQPDILDMIAERQRVEQKATPPQPTPTPAAPQPQQQQQQQRQETPPPPQPKPRPSKAESPVKHVTKPEAPPAPPVTMQAAPTTPALAPDQMQAQMAQSTAPKPDTDSDFEKKYGEVVSRQLMKSLIYPQEARKLGLSGITRVQFTLDENGQIVPGSVRVVSSSGSAELDDNAVKTVLAVAPFPPPGKPMTLSPRLKFGLN